MNKTWAMVRATWSAGRFWWLALAALLSVASFPVWLNGVTRGFQITGWTDITGFFPVLASACAAVVLTLQLQRCANGPVTRCAPDSRPQLLRVFWLGLIANWLIVGTPMVLVGVRLDSWWLLPWSWGAVAAVWSVSMIAAVIGIRLSINATTYVVVGALMVVLFQFAPRGLGWKGFDAVHPGAAEQAAAWLSLPLLMGWALTARWAARRLAHPLPASPRRRPLAARAAATAPPLAAQATQLLRGLPPRGWRSEVAQLAFMVAVFGALGYGVRQGWMNVGGMVAMVCIAGGNGLWQPGALRVSPRLMLLPGAPARAELALQLTRLAARAHLPRMLLHGNTAALVLTLASGRSVAASAALVAMAIGGALASLGSAVAVAAWSAQRGWWRDGLLPLSALLFTMVAPMAMLLAAPELRDAGATLAVGMGSLVFGAAQGAGLIALSRPAWRRIDWARLPAPTAQSHFLFHLNTTTSGGTP